MKRNNLFIKFANMLKPSHRAESGSAIIFSILLSIIVLSVVSVIIALSLTSVKKTSSSNAYTYFGDAATAAVNNAVFTANSSGGLTKINAATSASTAVKGVYNVNYSDQELKWEWYATKSSSIPNAEYTITATGYRVNATDAEARTVVAKIRSVRVTSGSYQPATNNIKYEVDSSNLNQWGFFGADSVQLKNGTLINSYVHSSSTPPANSNKEGTVASNGTLTLGGTATSLNKFNALNYNSASPVRCSGVVCDTTNQKKFEYIPSFDIITQRTTNACPRTPAEYPSFTSSANGTILSPGCYNNITIDADTTTPTSATAGSPAVIYLKGTLTIKSGKSFNAGKAPLTARFFSDTGTSAVFEQGGASTAASTRFSGYVAGGQLNCTDGGAGASIASNPSNAKLSFYGGLACKTLILSGGTIAWWDETMKDVSPVATTYKIWSIETFEDKSS